MSFQIRRAELRDLDTIVLFNSNMAAETESKTLDTGTLTKGVSLLFNDPSSGFYLVAESEGKVIGQLMITYETSDWRNGNFWWIQSVYVDMASRKKGVFKALYLHIEEEARKSANCCGIRLYVEEENHIALQVYHQMGLYKTHYLLLEKEFRSARAQE